YVVAHYASAHDYYATLINNTLLIHPLTTSFFSFRHFPEPNCIGHGLMAILGFVIPGFISEKIILHLWIIFLPVVFRKLILRINPDSVFLSYLVFPFIYSYAFYGGLYNFILGIPLLLYGLFFLIKKYETMSIKDFV